MLGEDGQQRLENGGVIEADAGFHGEGNVGDGLTHRAKDGIDAMRLTQQASARTLFVNDWCGAAEVEIDPGDGVLVLEEA